MTAVKNYYDIVLDIKYLWLIIDLKFVELSSQYIKSIDRKDLLSKFTSNLFYNTFICCPMGTDGRKEVYIG